MLPHKLFRLSLPCRTLIREQICQVLLFFRLFVIESEVLPGVWRTSAKKFAQLYQLSCLWCTVHHQLNYCGARMVVVY
jgi:hypothetical protein